MDNNNFPVFYTTQNIRPDIHQHMKGIKTKEYGLHLVANETTLPHAFITSRHFLSTAVLENPPDTFYLPPQTEDSTLFIDPMGMAIAKNFNWTAEFQRV